MARLVFLVLVLLAPAQAFAQSAAPLELYGKDALGREMPTSSKVRPFRDDRYVGIFYFLWMHLNYVHDNSKILLQYPEARQTTASPPWGPVKAYHFWGEPLFGYYRSDDPWVLRRHAALLSDAGVDFLVFDTTNGVIYENVVLKLMEVFDQQRRLGEHVPQVTFMVNSRAGRTAERIFKSFYEPARYPELWFRWQGKPLLICDPAEASPKLSAFFTLRKAHWPFKMVNTQNAWHWEATYPQVYSYDSDPSHPEQVDVSVGQNLHQDTGRVEMMSTGRARGRSYHDGKNDPRPNGYVYGLNFQEQWQRAFELDPEVVFITGWNEWIAMQLNQKEGPPVFCDQFNLEFSRDVEMMKGGYGDNYYMQMAASIRRFKGMRQAAAILPGKSIDVAGDFRQWDAVAKVYHDRALDTLQRDHRGCGDMHYRVDSGRNDFRILKVTHDRDYVYFYAETAESITDPDDSNWMQLLVGLADSRQPHWEGFQFRVNGGEPKQTQASIEVCLGGWDWKELGKIAFRVAGARLHLAIPKKTLGIHGESFALDFKWVDNLQDPVDILDTYVQGDTAPGGRFRYRYAGGPFQ